MEYSHVRGVVSYPRSCENDATGVQIPGFLTEKVYFTFHTTGRQRSVRGTNVCCTHTQPFQTNISEPEAGESRKASLAKMSLLPDTEFTMGTDRCSQRRLLAFLAVFVYLFLLLKFFFYETAIKTLIRQC